MSRNENKNYEAIPDPTLRRLSHYKFLLDAMKKEGRLIVSSALIAKELGFDSVQVKKDIQYAGIVGQPKKGYKIQELSNAIDEMLNWQKEEKAFLIGAGSLGTALLQYKGLKDCGVNIVAAFDRDNSKIGKVINGVEILEMDRMIVAAKMMKIRLGIIAVPETSAQACADKLIAGGITAIWNFSPVIIHADSNIIIENAQFIQSLAILTHKIGCMK